jgi:Uma2 family endonuclease
MDMTTLTAPAPRPKIPTENGAIPPLYNGDRLSQPEFHRRYQAMPQGVKAELIEGIVYMASPVGRRHGQGQIRLGGLLWLYENGTPGVEALDNATVILGDESEPQPDLHLRILPGFGGRVIESKRGILEGAPELVAEVAHSSEAIDLHAKRRDYQSAGVLEYVVLIVREGRLRAFDLSSGLELKESSDGIYRSKTFPGLWLDIPAIVAGVGNQAHRTLNKGLKSPEHTAFVKRLKKAEGLRRSRRK